MSKMLTMNQEQIKDPQRRPAASNFSIDSIISSSHKKSDVDDSYSRKYYKRSGQSTPPPSKKVAGRQLDSPTAETDSISSGLSPSLPTLEEIEASQRSQRLPGNPFHLMSPHAMMNRGTQMFSREHSISEPNPLSQSLKSFTNRLPHIYHPSQLAAMEKVNQFYSQQPNNMDLQLVGLPHSYNPLLNAFNGLNSRNPYMFRPFQGNL